MSIFKNLAGFLGRYATEATATATALNMIVDNLPIQSQDKAQIRAHIGALAKAAEGIGAFLANNDGKGLDTGATVKIDAADVRKAVAEILANDKAFKSAVDQAVAARLPALVEKSAGEAVPAIVSRELAGRFGDGVQPVADPARDLRETDNAAALATRETASTRDLQNAADGEGKDAVRERAAADAADKAGKEAAAAERKPEKSGGK